MLPPFYAYIVQHLLLLVWVIILLIKKLSFLVFSLFSWEMREIGTFILFKSGINWPMVIILLKKNSLIFLLSLFHLCRVLFRKLSFIIFLPIFGGYDHVGLAHASLYRGRAFFFSRFLYISFSRLYYI
jgi:hypothetical protein